MQPEDARTVSGTPRERRRAQTQTEILDAALEVMSEDGVAALNLTRVANLVGLRQPSLYQYFPSRDAVYDALFERGMRDHLAAVEVSIDTAAGPGWRAACAGAHATLRFTAEHPVLAQLLFRPAIPGFHPSERAYAPSLEVQRRMSTAITDAVTHGELHPRAATERGLKLFVALVAGVANQRAANDPDQREEQQLHHLLDLALDMFAQYFTPQRAADWTPWPTPGPTPH